MYVCMYVCMYVYLYIYIYISLSLSVSSGSVRMSGVGLLPKPLESSRAQCQACSLLRAGHNRNCSSCGGLSRVTRRYRPKTCK